MEVLFIRHADPDYANDTITELGHRQARALVCKVAAVDIRRLYVSPMGRAQITASYLAEAWHLEPATLEWLRELDGNWEGDRWAWNTPAGEILGGGEVPETANWHRTTAYGAHMHPQWEALAQRFDELLAGIGYVREGPLYRVDRSYAGAIACVCHAGTTTTLLSYLLNWALPLVYVHVGCAPCSVTRIAWEEHDGYAAPRLVSLGELPAYGRTPLLNG